MLYSGLFIVFEIKRVTTIPKLFFIYKFIHFCRKHYNISCTLRVIDKIIIDHRRLPQLILLCEIYILYVVKKKNYIQTKDYMDY